MALDELPLPRRELDLAEMLGARADLREHAWPVFPTAVDLVAADAPHGPSSQTADLRHRRLAGLDEPGVLAVLVDPELPDAAGMPGDDAVAEIQTQQGYVGRADAAVIDTGDGVWRQGSTFWAKVG
jgi:hypothetical protein